MRDGEDQPRLYRLGGLISPSVFGRADSEGIHDACEVSEPRCMRAGTTGGLADQPAVGARRPWFDGGATGNKTAIKSVVSWDRSQVESSEPRHCFGVSGRHGFVRAQDTPSLCR